GPVGPGPLRPVAAVATALGPRRPPALRSGGPVAVAVPWSGPVAPGDEARRHEALGPLLTTHLDPLGLRALLLARGKDRRDRDPVDLELGLGTDEVADLRTLEEERGVEHALRLLGPGRAPRPRAVVARARKLDVDPAGHAAPKLLQWEDGARWP